MKAQDRDVLIRLNESIGVGDFRGRHCQTTACNTNLVTHLAVITLTCVSTRAMS